GRSDFLPGRVGCRHLHDVEFTAHEVGRGRGRRVPEVARLDAHEARPLARHDVVEVATPDAAWKEIGAAGQRTAFVGAAAEEAGAHGVPPAGVNPKALVARP